MISPPRIPLDPLPGEAKAFSKDAGWAMVAGLACRKGFTNKDWRLAMRAFRLYVDAMRAGGLPAFKGAGLSPLQAEQFFDTYYIMLTLRRALAAQDRDAGKLPEEDE